MAIIAETFLDVFPEFSNNAVYPISQINFWITEAYKQLNASRFGQELDLAAMLFIAHNIVLSARAVLSTATGNPGQAPGIPGESTGAVNSKGAGGVHIGFDTAAVQTPGAGPWNATSYGQRLYKMMVATGGFAYVTPSYGPGAGYGGGPVWPNGWRVV